MRELRGCTKPASVVKVNTGLDRWRCDPVVSAAGAVPADLVRRVGEVARERLCWDPKDGELCLSRLKPEETLVEGRSDSDVQIDRPIWA